MIQKDDLMRGMRQKSDDERGMRRGGADAAVADNSSIASARTLPASSGLSNAPTVVLFFPPHLILASKLCRPTFCTPHRQAANAVLGGRMLLDPA